MCGILGAMFFPTEKRIKNRLWATQMILAEAFAESKDRGKDASGAAVIAGDYYAVVKGPWVSDEFMIKDKEEPIVSPVLGNGVSKPFEAFNQICRRKENDLSLIMMHTRAKTQGSEYENKNNHPILIPNEEDKDAIIIGVHNGVIRNDTQIRKQLRKDNALVTDAEVDSAAIFEVINNSLREDEPTLELMDEVAKWLDGQMAVCAVSRHHPNRVMFWRDGRPLEYLVAENSGIIFFSSDDKYVKEAISRYNRGRLLFKERRELPEIEFETKIHTDDWSVLFDTSKVLGVSTKGKYGIAEFAEEKRTVKEIYTDVQSPASSASRNWNNYTPGVESDEDKAKKYLTTISNAIEKDPATHKDSAIEDLSPKEEVAPEEKFLPAEKTVEVKDVTVLNDNDEVLVEGEILTKPSSDDGPDQTLANSDEEDDTDLVTADVYDAAVEELDRLKEGESVISSLEEVIERCISESDLEEYTNSLEAMVDLYDSIFEEAFATGVAWRDRTNTDKEEVLELKVKAKALRENRDEIERLLTKEIDKRLSSQGYVLALRITLKVILETLLDKLTTETKNTLVSSIHKALILNKVMKKDASVDSISNIIFPTVLRKKTSPSDKKTVPAPVRRIDKFLNSIGDFMKNRSQNKG